MEIDPVEPSQRQKDSGDGKVAAAVEAVAKQVAAVEEQVAMMAGPSQTHKKRRVLMELFPSGGVAPREPPSYPNPMPSSSSHGLNDAASAVAQQAAVAGGPIAATREEPLEPAAEEPAAADSPSPAHSGTVPRMRRGRGKNTLMFSITLP